MALRTFADVLDLWDSAEELGADIDVSGGRIRMWRQRDSIPAEEWPGIIGAAAARGFRGVTLELLSALYTKRWKKAA